ncbi:MAG: hypothetical protein GEU96_22900 [Propionibacteriales bacterium]|nr:hypothetical protein [Propionibacteriales bacterium]
MTLRGRLAATATLAVLVAVPTAGCTRDGGDAREPSPSPSASVSESPAPGEPVEVAIGQPATVDLTGSAATTQVAVTVTRVRRGRIQDLKDFVLDATVKQATPYYADVRIENTGEGAPSGATLTLWGLDSTDTVLPAADVRGTFGRCATKPLPKRFPPGSKAASCLLFLVPKGATLDEVQYRFNDGTTGPYSWPVPPGR